MEPMLYQQNSTQHTTFGNISHRMDMIHTESLQRGRKKEDSTVGKFESGHLSFTPMVVDPTILFREWRFNFPDGKQPV